MGKCGASMSHTVTPTTGSAILREKSLQRAYATDANKESQFF